MRLLSCRQGYRNSHLTCIYFVAGSGLIKIGYSKRPLTRLSGMQVGSPTPLTMLWFMRCHLLAEEILHMALADQWAHGEWFYPHPRLTGFIDRRKQAEDRVLNREIMTAELSLLAGENIDAAKWAGLYGVAFDEQYTWNKVRMAKPAKISVDVD